MIAAFLALFAALAACQAVLAVKLADRLSPANAAGNDEGAVRVRGGVRLA